MEGIRRGGKGGGVRGKGKGKGEMEGWRRKKEEGKGE